MEYKSIRTTPNKTAGTNTCEFLILHHTATGFGTAQSVVNRFCTSGAGASCHYVVDTNGDIYKVGEETDILWHTGESSWKGKSKAGSLNAFAIGIEVIGPLNDGGFTDQQRVAVSLLVQDICTRRNIKKEEFLRHKDIAPGRKVDIYDSFWNGKYKTWDDYRNSLFVPNICPDVPANARFADAVQWAIAKGITNAGPQKNFNPDKPATRAEVVQFLKNFADSLSK